MAKPTPITTELIFLMMSLLPAAGSEVTTTGLECRDDRGIPIAVVEPEKLVPPFEVSRHGVESHDRVGEEIGAGPCLVGKIGARITDGYQEQPGRGVDGCSWSM
jgi:hypothetical protein